MVTPRLIHPVAVTIEPIDRSATRFDRAAREPIPRLRRKTSVTLQAQIHWGRREDREPKPAGPEERSDGFLVFDRAAMDTAGYAPVPGDRVRTIEGAAVELYLTSAGQARGQYRGRSHLVRAYFEDRQPRHD